MLGSFALRDVSWSAQIAIVLRRGVVCKNGQFLPAGTYPGALRIGARGRPRFFIFSLRDDRSIELFASDMAKSSCIVWSLVGRAA